MRLGFSPSTGTPYPFIASAFAPSTYARYKGVTGLGLSTQTNEIGSMVATGIATTGSIMTALVSATSSLALAGPIGAAAAGLIAVGLGIANLFKGCGQTCVLATQDANQLETYWQQNLNTYMNAPVHYYSLQQGALNNFDVGWAALYKACSDPSLGAAGQRCISERQRGGASSWCCNAPNAVQVGNGMCTGCDAFVTFRDPIANDPNVVPDPPLGVTSAGSETVLGGGTVSAPSYGFPLPLLLIGGGILAFSMMEGN